ncbi:alpha-glucosidase/alpha-galactosidase [Vibrio nomapromontoriensis]|uniref:alpha-glucosidase/alpha-galactosidase n=1 Tax=Vibrio nomapromontoriensis TaxID=2910246 RepID=UPI003D0E4911
MKQPKICVIGAGSTVFVKNILGDTLHLAEFKHCHIALHDIDALRLDESTLVVTKLAHSLGAEPTVTSTLDRKLALKGADFVICMFQVGGYEPATVIDFEIPKAFGLRQTIADTLGIGGIMRALRTIPVFIDIAADMRSLCPKATMLNYVNPMAMISWAMSEMAPDINYVGLCHSVQGTAAELAYDLNLDANKLRYTAAGINHVAFMLNLEIQDENGEWQDVYPILREAYHTGKVPKPNLHNPRCENKVRYEMMMRLGYFVTESSEHFAEYTPWFIKEGRQDLIEKYKIPLDEYPQRCVEQIASWKNEIQSYVQAERIMVEQSHEYASKILNSLWTGEPSVIYGNVANNGLIDNLPQGCAVEVPCLIDANGVQPVKIGRLPEQLAAVMRTNINVQSLVIESLKKKRRDHIYHAAMLDPHTGAVLDLEQIWQLCNELISAHQNVMPDYLKD